MIYNVQSVSGGQQSESLLQIYPLLFFFFKIFFSRLGYYRALTRVPCATQQVLMSYLCYIYSVYMSTPISQPLLHSLSFGCTVSLMLRMGFLQLQ